jgi:Lipase (class 3)
MTTYWVEFDFNMVFPIDDKTNPSEGPPVTFLGHDLHQESYQQSLVIQFPGGGIVSDLPYFDWFYSSWRYDFVEKGTYGPDGNFTETGVEDWNYTTTIANYYVAGTQPDPTTFVGPVLSDTEHDDAFQEDKTVTWNEWAWATITLPGGPLFTTGADTVNFNALTSDQQQAIANGADTTHGLGGNDLVTLPNSGTATFFTGSTTADSNYRVVGGSGTYSIFEGAGTEFVTINGNGSSNITAGSGADTITINGNGTNNVIAGSGNETVSISGGGSLKVTGAFVGSASIGVNSTLELNGSASGGPISFAGPNGKLQIDSNAIPTNVISGFSPGDTIDLNNVAWTSGGAALLTSGNNLSIIDGGQSYQFSLATSPSSSQTFVRAPDRSGGTDIRLANDPSLIDYLEFASLSYALTPDSLSIPSNWDIFGWTPVNPLYNSTGLTAVTFLDKNPLDLTYDDAVVAFRGSTTSHDWFVTDPKLAVGYTPPEFAAAVSYFVSEEKANPSFNFFVTGHSLGGAEAEVVAAATGAGGVTFAAPGVGNMLATTNGDASFGANLTNYVIADDPVGTHTFLSGQHVGPVVTLPPVDHFSSIFLGGLLGVVSGNPAIGASVAIGVSALLDHRLASYAQALANEGLISSSQFTTFSTPSAAIANATSGTVASGDGVESGTVNVSTSSAAIVEDLSEIYPDIFTVTTGIDASGNAVESGTVNVTTSIGTAIATISEAVSPAGVTTFSETITSGQESASQVALLTSSGLIADEIFLDGVNISTPLSEPADLNIASDGSLIVGTSSQTAGNEITVEAVTSSDFEVFVGGDSSITASQQNLSTAGHIGTTLNLATSGDQNLTYNWNVPSPTLLVISDSSATRGQVLSLANLVTILDPDSVGYQALEVWDSNGTAARGQFVVNGVAQPANQVIDVAPANFANTAFDVGALGGSDTLMARLIQDDGTATAWQSFIVSAPPLPANPAPPGGTTAIMVMNNPSNSDYEIYDVGSNAILAAYQLGQVGAPWRSTALGTFQAGDSSDMLLRNGSTGAFEAYYLSGNNITDTALVGTVGLDWNFAGVGSFDGASSLSELMLRNASSGSFELYQVAGGGVLSGSSVAPVGNNFQVKGFGGFSSLAETQMIMQDNTNDASAGQLELYTYQSSTASLAGIDVGKVGSNLSIVGCADLLGNGTTQMVMQQNNGNFWLYSYDAGTNSLSGQLVAAIGSNFHVIGFGPLNSAGQDEMLMQDAAGDLEVYQYNASFNAFAGQSMGAVGAPWMLDGIAAAPLSGSSAADTSNAQLLQAMAGFGGGNGAADVLNTGLVNTDASQQTLLTMPQHA